MERDSCLFRVSCVAQTARLYLSKPLCSDYLLYGTGSSWGNPQKVKHVNLYAVPWAGGRIHQLCLTHGVDRIEEMGSDAVVVGTDGNNLHFSSLRLGEAPEVADEYVAKGASQGELRSQGFFYRADTRNSGILGLPISTPARAGYHHIFENSAAILFLRNDSLHFQEGENWQLAPNAPQTTVAAPPVSTGTATLAPCSCAAGSSLC